MASKKEEDNQNFSPNDFVKEDSDWFLRYFVDIANKSDEEGDGIPITCSIGGNLICGELIGGKEYFKLIGEMTTGNKNDEISKTLRERMKNFGEFAYDLEKVKFEDIIYFHLKNASFYGAGKPIPQNGTFWRGKIKSVDGFFVGTLGVG